MNWVQRKCKHCGKEWRMVWSRYDKWYCSPECKAKFHRENGAIGVRPQMPKDLIIKCEQCEKEFAINDYAVREGQRKARYCSNKCRQRAYRIRRLENR